MKQLQELPYNQRKTNETKQLKAYTKPAKKHLFLLHKQSQRVKCRLSMYNNKIHLWKIQLSYPKRKNLQHCRREI